MRVTSQDGLVVDCETKASSPGLLTRNALYSATVLVPVDKCHHRVHDNVTSFFIVIDLQFIFEKCPHENPLKSKRYVLKIYIWPYLKN